MTHFLYVNSSTRMFSHSDSDWPFFSYDPRPRKNRPRKNPLSPSLEGRKETKGNAKTDFREEEL